MSETLLQEQRRREAEEVRAAAREARVDDLADQYMEDPMVFRDAIMEHLVEDEAYIKTLFDAVRGEDGVRAVSVLKQALHEWALFEAEKYVDD